MVIEFSKDTLKDILGATLDKTSCIGRIIGNSLSELWGTRASGTIDSRIDVFLPFRFNMRFLNNDLPPPKEFAAGPVPRNSVAFSARIGLKEQPLGGFGLISTVDTVPVTFKNWTWDIVRLNLESRPQNEFQSYLSIAQVDDLGLNSSFHNILTKVRTLPLLPIPTKATSNKPAEIIRTYIKLTPDVINSNQDVMTPGTVILSLVFGGNTTNPSPYTQNFLQNQESAAIAIAFGWIKRLFLAELEGFLPGISQNIPGGLNTGGDFKLTFDLTISNNKMEINATLKKNGDPISIVPGILGIPYDATLNMSAEIELSINNKGEPTAQLKSFNPTTSINIHHDYVTAALNQVLGTQSAQLVGTLFANLQNLLDESLNSAVTKALELAKNTLQNTLTSALEKVGKALKTTLEAIASKVGDQNGFVTIPIIDTEIHLSRILIDNNNIMVSCQILPKDNIPLRKEGEITIRPGLFVDLDCAATGRMLSTRETASASLRWVRNKKTGLGNLDTVGLAKAAIDDRKGHRQDPAIPLALETVGLKYENILHYKLHEFAYEVDKAIKQNDIVPKLSHGKTTGKTFAFMTAEGRYCLIKANSVNPTTGAITLQYRTYSPYCLIGRLDYLLGLPIILF